MRRQANSFVPGSVDEKKGGEVAKDEGSNSRATDDYLGITMVKMQRKASSNVKSVTDDDVNKFGKARKWTTRRSKDSLEYAMPMSKSKSATPLKMAKKFTLIQKAKAAGKPLLTKEQAAKIESSLEKTIEKKLTEKPSILDKTGWWEWINFTWTFNLIAVSKDLHIFEY